MNFVLPNFLKGGYAGIDGPAISSCHLRQCNWASMLLSWQEFASTHGSVYGNRSSKLFICFAKANVSVNKARERFQNGTKEEVYSRAPLKNMTSLECASISCFFALVEFCHGHDIIGHSYVKLWNSRSNCILCRGTLLPLLST